MSGCRRGVQKLYTEQVPHALYMHCYAHRLNLVIVECCNSVDPARHFFTLLQDLYVFVSSSVVHTKFVATQRRIS